ncbi:hypothetical protein ACFPYI_07610 [Halomarina salina]|uniref:Sulfatase n=1 Tax=Halomarina salina TaxID=1872699 RepID=A0ABD5RL04_9EURY|nr:hypothetical protein [Halomarina salina]
MYSVSSIANAIRNPRVVCEEANLLYQHGFGFRETAAHNENGVDILSEDWDNLVILDACRYDTFRDLASELPGTLTKAESKASATNLFLRANFTDEELHDTVYVTANPQLYRIENGVYDVEPIHVEFHDQIDVWQDQWHDEYRTVMPEVVTEAALDAAERYPNKRLIVHYLQPHAPYIGETGVEHLPTDYLDFWGSFNDGEIDVPLETAKQAYRENVEVVLPHVSTLLAEFDGKTVVTADHGELLGERDSPIPIRRYGHPAYANVPALLEVPWLEYETETRPDIVAEAPEQAASRGGPDSDVVRERLQDLGYAE